MQTTIKPLLEKPQNKKNHNYHPVWVSQLINPQFYSSRVWLVIILAVGWGVNSCDDGNLVDSSPGGDEVQVKADTALIPSTQEVSAPGFSGNQQYLSVGHYNDLLFGEKEVTALLQPNIIEEGIDSIESNATAFLEMHVDEVYGNVTSSNHLQLNEAPRRWRASAWRPDSAMQVSDILVGESIHEPEDETVTIPVDDNWLQRYREYFNEGDEDGYREELFGFTLTSLEESNILSFDMGQSQLVIDNPTADTLQSTGFRATAYSLERGEPSESITEEVSINRNTFDNFMKLEFDVDSDFIGADNISRAELIIYVDSESMESAEYLPENHQRNEADVLDMYFLDESDLELSITDDPLFRVSLNEGEDGNPDYFSVNLTAFIRDQLTADEQEEEDFYLIISENNGKLLSSLLFNHLHDEYAPQIHITSADPN